MIVESFNVQASTLVCVSWNSTLSCLKFGLEGVSRGLEGVSRVSREFTGVSRAISKRSVCSVGGRVQRDTRGYYVFVCLPFSTTEHVSSANHIYYLRWALIQCLACVCFRLALRLCALEQCSHSLLSLRVSTRLCPASVSGWGG